MNTQALPCRWLAGLTTAFLLSWAISASAQTTQHSGFIVSHADFYGSGTGCSHRLSSLGEMGTGFDYRDAAKTDWKGSIKWRFLKRVGKSDVYHVEWKYEPKEGVSTGRTEELTFDGVTPTKLVVNDQWVISFEPNQKTTEGSKKTLIATIFGDDIFLEQFMPAEAEAKRNELSPADFEKWLLPHQGARVYDHVWRVVLKRYIEREKIGVSDEEMIALKKSAERRSAATRGNPDESPFPPLEHKGIEVAMARASLMDWKISKSLYEKYGGRVGMGSLGAWIALDGQEALLRERHTAGDLKFHHPEIATAFWEYARRKQFADAYPKGEELSRLFATPPYLWADTSTHVEATKRERIGSALGQDVYRDQLKDSPPTYHQVVQLFMAPAMEEFERKHLSNYEMSDDELREGVAWMDAEKKKRWGWAWQQWQAQSKELQANVNKQLAEIKRQLDDPATSENERPMLKTALRVNALEATHPHAGEVWLTMHRRKFEKYLHFNYGGGRIIHQQFGPEALDARRNLLLELEKSGKFEITDPSLRKIAYDYWERPNHPGGFHTDHRLLMFPWTDSYKALMREYETGKPVEPSSKGAP